MNDDKASELTKEEKDELDEKIEQLRPKMFEEKEKYDAIVAEYAELLDKRYPERRPERIKEVLYEVFINSNKSLNQVLDFMIGHGEGDG